MSHTYQTRTCRALLWAGSAAILGGCQAMQPPAPYANYNNAPYQQQAPVAPASETALMQSAGYNFAQYQQLQQSTSSLKERLDRAEKAILRLDRRVQLLETSELDRMGRQDDQTSANDNGSAAMRALSMPAAQDSSAYHSVSSPDNAVSAAFQTASAGTTSIRFADNRNAMPSGLPSLADPEGSGRALQPGDSSVAIWTVHYDGDSVWPDRAELPASRDVVEALRQSDKVSLFARGKNASSDTFRQRVKALSRYLSRVSSLDSVPIAAMAAPSLGGDTIEILATHD